MVLYHNYQMTDTSLNLDPESRINYTVHCQYAHLLTLPHARCSQHRLIRNCFYCCTIYNGDYCIVGITAAAIHSIHLFSDLQPLYIAIVSRPARVSETVTNAASILLVSKEPKD